MGLQLFGSKKDAPLTMGTALVALLGSTSASAEQIDAANQELEAAGLQGAQLVPTGTLEELQTAQASVQATTDALAAAGATDVAELVAQRDEAREQAAKFGDQPGALGTTSEKTGNDVAESAEEKDDSWQAIHNRMLNS